MSGISEVLSGVSIINGESIINITGQKFNASKFAPGVLIVINGYQPVEAISGSNADINNDSVIVLKHPWSNPTIVDGRFIAFNSREGFSSAVDTNRQVATGLSEMVKKLSTFSYGGPGGMTAAAPADNIDLIDYDEWLVDTNTQHTRNLPSNPADGSTILIKDDIGLCGTNNIRFSGNGKTVMGSTDIYALTTDWSWVIIKYFAYRDDWRIIMGMV